MRLSKGGLVEGFLTFYCDYLFPWVRCTSSFRQFRKRPGFLIGALDRCVFVELSPTLEYIGYTLPGADSSKNETYLSRVDDSEPTLLATGSSAINSFSPDGRYFFIFVGENCSNGKVIVGSLEGDAISVPGAVRIWINNRQFIYQQEDDTIMLGDVSGHWTQIAPASDTTPFFDAVDLAFNVVFE
jgi:hypothetical protein